eukprot:292238-Chlamydomonas_euryale.AAC.3
MGCTTQYCITVCCTTAMHPTSTQPRVQRAMTAGAARPPQPRVALASASASVAALPRHLRLALAPLAPLPPDGGVVCDRQKSSNDAILYPLSGAICSDPMPLPARTGVKNSAPPGDAVPPAALLDAASRPGAHAGPATEPDRPHCRAASEEERGAHAGVPSGAAGRRALATPRVAHAVAPGALQPPSVDGGDGTPDGVHVGGLHAAWNIAMRAWKRARCAAAARTRSSLRAAHARQAACIAAGVGLGPAGVGDDKHAQGNQQVWGKDQLVLGE